MILSEESTLIGREPHLPFRPSLIPYRLQTLRLFLLLLLRIYSLRTNQHHTNDIPNHQTTIMRRLIIIIPKHLSSELLALRQIIAAEQVHSLGIRKSGVKGCESAFGDYKAELGPADLEFVGRGCGGHSFGRDWRGKEWRWGLQR